MQVYFLPLDHKTDAIVSLTLLKEYQAQVESRRVTENRVPKIVAIRETVGRTGVITQSVQGYPLVFKNVYINESFIISRSLFKPPMKTNEQVACQFDFVVIYYTSTNTTKTIP